MFGKQKTKVEMPLKIAVSKIKVPQEYRCLKVVIKRGKKEKKIGVLEVNKGFANVPNNQQYDDTGKFDMNNKTGEFDSKAASFEVHAAKSPKDKYKKIFEEAIDLAHDLNANKKPDSNKVNVHVPDLRLSA